MITSLVLFSCKSSSSLMSCSTSTLSSSCSSAMSLSASRSDTVSSSVSIRSSNCRFLSVNFSTISSAPRESSTYQRHQHIIYHLCAFHCVIKYICILKSKIFNTGGAGLRLCSIAKNSYSIFFMS